MEAGPPVKRQPPEWEVSMLPPEHRESPDFSHGEEVKARSVLGESEKCLKSRGVDLQERFDPAEKQTHELQQIG